MVESRKNSTPEGFEPLLNLKEAAVLLGLHWKTLEVMARNRKVPGVKLGRRWKFRASNLDDWLQHRLNSQHNHAALTGKEQHP
jgi:excisionase family DNA binding protein